MGMPVINITFKELSKTVATRAERGIVALILKDTKHSIFTMQGESEIPESLNVANKKMLKLLFKGNVSTVNKAIVYVLGSEGNVDDAFNYFENQQFTLFCFPEAEAEKTKVKAFIEKMNNIVKYKTDAIMFNEAADSEAIINVTAKGVELENETASNADVLCRIAGIIEGTPVSQAVTFVNVLDATKIEQLTVDEANTRIDNGELILVKEMGKVKIARGVNSLKTLAPDKGASFKKIKLRKIMNILHNDIRLVIIEKYIGKKPNSYDNKCILISEIIEYLEDVAKEQLIENDFSVEIDIEAQKKWLKANTNLDVDNMNEQQIKIANTGSNVFIAIKVKLIDSMEDVFIAISI